MSEDAGILSVVGGVRVKFSSNCIYWDVDIKILSNAKCVSLPVHTLNCPPVANQCVKTKAYVTQRFASC